ncbi:MAG: hypothetical protein ACKOQ8_04505 [Micrococcales bacterium]
MGYLMDHVNVWNAFISKYGAPQEVSLEFAKNADKSTVWTMWDRGDEFLVNEFVEHGEVLTYFVTPRPWTEAQGTVVVVVTCWVDCITCEANEDDEDWDMNDCEECEGGGVVSIIIPDCAGETTDEGVLSHRQA